MDKFYLVALFLACYSVIIWKKGGVVRKFLSSFRREVAIAVDTLEKTYSWVQGGSRGTLYSFLSAVFKDESSTGQVEEFFENNLASLQETFALLPEKRADLLLKHLNILAAVWKERCKKNGPEAENLELRKEFAYLFLTPHGVHPFESMYRGKRKHLMDTPWEKVRNFYRRIGLEKNKEEKHPEDHVAVELGLMASLAFLSGMDFSEEEGDSFGKEEQAFALQVQRDFLREHLLAWIPRFCNDVVEKTRHPFYRSVAALAALFVEADGQMLQELEPGSN